MNTERDPFADACRRYNSFSSTSNNAATSRAISYSARSLSKCPEPRKFSFITRDIRQKTLPHPFSKIITTQYGLVPHPLPEGSVHIFQNTRHNKPGIAFSSFTIISCADHPEDRGVVHKRESISKASIPSVDAPGVCLDHSLLFLYFQVCVLFDANRIQVKIAA